MDRSRAQCIRYVGRFTCTIFGCFPAMMLGAIIVRPVGGQRPVQQLELTEVVRASATRHDLSVVGLITAGPSGTLWISQPQDGDIGRLRMNESGIFKIGGRGGGPGEFREVTGLWADDSEIWVFDRSLMRVTTLGVGGRLKSTVRVTRPAGMIGPISIRAGSNGHAVYYDRADSDGHRWLYVAEYDGTVLARLLQEELSSCSVGSRTGNKTTSMRVPLCHQTQDGFSGNGHYRAIARPMPNRNGATGFTVAVTGWQGDTVWAGSHELGNSRIPRSVRDSVISSIRRLGAARNLPVADHIIDKDLVPRTFPPVIEIDVTDSGGVFVTTQSGMDGEKSVVVFAPDGDTVGVFGLQNNQQVRWAGTDRVAIVESDSDGLQDVVLYAVEKMR